MARPGELKFFQVYDEDLNSFTSRISTPILERLRALNNGTFQGDYTTNPQDMDFFSPLDRGIIPIDNDGRPLREIKDLHIPFQFVDGYTEQKSANYSTTNLMGRFEPVALYSDSTPRQINFELTYVALGDVNVQYATEGQRPRYETSEGAIQEIVDKWNSYMYPSYSDSPHYRRPYLALLNYGAVFQNVPCRITSVNVNRDAIWPEDRKTSLKRIVKVSVNFETNYRLSQVINRLDVARNAPQAYRHGE